MKLFKKSKPQTITLPIDVFEFCKGDVVETDNFFKSLDESLNRNEAELDSLRYKNERLRRELENCRAEVEDFCREHDPYRYFGVRKSDFQ